MRLRRLRAAAQPVGVWTARHLIARGFKTSQPPIVGDGTKLLPAVHAFIASAVLAGGLLTWQHDLANKDEVAEARLRSDLTALFKTLDLTGDGTLQCGTGEVKRMLRNPEFLLLVSETHIPKEAVFSYLDKDDSRSRNSFPAWVTRSSRDAVRRTPRRSGASSSRSMASSNRTGRSTRPPHDRSSVRWASW